MISSPQYLTFYIDQELYGLPLHTIEKVIRAVALIHYAENHSRLDGFINIEGQIVPVVNLRAQLGLAERKIDINDRIIIARTGKQPIALVADQIGGVIEIDPGDNTSDTNISLQKGCIRRIVSINGETIKLCDTDCFLKKKILKAWELTQKGYNEGHTGT